MRRENRWLFTAVTLFLLLVLAACGGGVGDAEATGSESVGNVLPTPITGAKVWPTRATAIGLMPDILIIAPSARLTAVDLNILAAQLALPNGQFALVLYGDTAPTGVFDFTREVAELTAVFDTTPAPTPPLALSAAWAAGLQLSGWRVDSDPRLLVLVVDESVPDEEILTLAATAVSQNIHLAIVQPPEAADWAEVADMGNGRVLLLPENQTPGDMGTVVATLIMEALAETTP